MPLLALYAWAFAEPRDVISEAEREVTVAGIVTDEEGNHVIAAKGFTRLFMLPYSQ